MGTIQEAVQLVVDATPAEQGARQFAQALDKVVASERQTQQVTATLDEALKRLGDREAYAGEGMRKLAGGFGANAAALRGLDATIRSLGQIVDKSAAEFRAYGDAVANTARKTAELSAAARASQTNLTSLLGGATRLAALFGVGLGIRTSVTAISSFERAIAQVGAISRASADELRQIRDQSAELGATTEKTATQAAEGALLLARAGFDAQKILGALPGTLKLSVAGALDLGESAEIAANSLAQFGLAASETNRVTNSLLVTASSSNTDVRQLAEALKFAGSVAGSVGQDIETVSAALGVLGDRGIQGSLAGRALRGIFLDLRSPTAEARNELNRFGADLSKLDPRFNNLVDIADELGKAFRAGADAGRIFGAEQAAQATILGQSVDRIVEIVEAQKQWQTATEDVSKALTSTLSGSLKSFESAIEGVAIKAGDEGLSGTLKGVVDRATETVRKLGGLEKGVGQFGAQTTVAAAAIETFAFALGAVGAAKFLQFVGSAVTLVPRLTASLIASAKAWGSLNAAAVSTPWGAIGTAIAGVVTIGLAYSRRLDEIAHSQDEVAKSAREFQTAIDGVAKTLDRSSRQALTGPLTESQAIRQQIKEVQGLERSIQDVAGLANSTKLDFANTAAFQEQIRKTAAGIDDLERKISKQGFKIRGDFFQRTDPESAAQLQALKVLRDNLTQQPIRIADILVAPAGETLRTLFDAAGLTEDFRKLAEEGRKLTGLEQPFIPVADAIDLLRSKVPELNDQIEKLRDTYERVTGTTKDFSIAIRRGLETLDEDRRTLDDRRRLLSQVEAGVLTLADAEARLNIERDVRAKTSAAIKTAEAVQGKLSDEATESIQKQVRALVESRAAADQWESRLRNVTKAQKDTSGSAEELVAALEKQAATLTRSKDPAEQLRAVLDELRKVTVEGSDDFTRYADRASDAINEIVRAQARQREEQQKDQEARQAQQSADRFQDILRGLRQQRDAYLLTRDALNELVAVEEVRRLGLGREAEERARDLAQQIAQLDRIRELSGSVAGGIGDALRTLKDGGSGRDALQSLLQGAGDRLFESSIQRLEEQITTGLTSALAGAFGGAGAGPVPGATPGEDAIVQAVRSVENAIRQQTATQQGTAAGGGSAAVPGGTGFNWGNFASSLAVAGVGIGLSLLSRRRGGGGSSGDLGGFGVLPTDRSNGAPVFDQSRITVNQYVAPDRVRLTATQASKARDAIWRR